MLLNLINKKFNKIDKFNIKLFLIKKMNISGDNIIIGNIENYNISFHDGNMILTRKIKKEKNKKRKYIY